MLLGFAAVGLGLANAVPILFSAAGKLAAVPPSIGIAAVSTAGYCGFLLGPPVIGLVAERFGLGTGLGLVVIALATIAMSGPGHIAPVAAQPVRSSKVFASQHFDDEVTKWIELIDRVTAAELSLASTETARPHIVIIGAGFGGLSAAMQLGKVDADVTVIDRRNYHLFQPLLYQVATAALSPADIAAPIRGILARQPNANVILGTVTGIDMAGRAVLIGQTPHPLRPARHRDRRAQVLFRP